MSGKIFNKIALSTGIGAGTGIIVSSLFITILAGILAIGNIPAMLIAPVTVFVIVVGGFFGGFVSARICGEKGLICGAFSGIVFFMILWISGGILGAGGFGMGAVIKSLMIIFSASLGGIIGVNYNKRK